MRCEVCGRVLRNVEGVFFVNGKWLLMNAGYCYQHGSFISKKDLEVAEEVTPDPTYLCHIRPGLHVRIHAWENQADQPVVEGYVKSIITSSRQHKDGIKVMLSNGKIGRVKEILE